MAHETAPDRNMERRVRGLFLGGFAGPELPGSVASALRDGLRGVVLFAGNVADREQVAGLTRQVHAVWGEGVSAAGADAGGGCLVGIDQEGGRVARLREGFWVPSAMRELGAMAEPGALELAREVGRVLAGQLRWCGVNLNFAPVLDVDTNPANPVIGSRSLSADPQRVAALGVALTRGLQEGRGGAGPGGALSGDAARWAGVAACGKHFPGHGDTHQDSHLTLPRLPHDRARLERVELVPFRAAIAGRVAGQAELSEPIASLMTAHVVFEALGETRPATMSRGVIDGLLRQELGFGGVVVSDDLEMKAIADHYPIGEVAVSAIDAGVDLLLCCHHLELIEQAVSAVLEAVASGRLSRQRIESASRRVDAMARRYRVDLSQVGGDYTAVREAEARVAARWAELAGAVGQESEAGDQSAAGDPTEVLRAAGGNPYHGGA